MLTRGCSRRAAATGFVTRSKSGANTPQKFVDVPEREREAVKRAEVLNSLKESGYSRGSLKNGHRERLRRARASGAGYPTKAHDPERFTWATPFMRVVLIGIRRIFGWFRDRIRISTFGLCVVNLLKLHDIARSGWRDFRAIQHIAEAIEWGNSGDAK